MAIAASRPPLTRRQALALGVGAMAGAGLGRPLPVLTILGDSITAGYGLPAAAALPAQIARALAGLGHPAEVRGAGVSGDTTAGGLARVAFSVQSDTRVCLVALGGNDLLRGLEPAETRANLTRIVASLKRRRIGVVIAGLTAPAVIGPGYAQAFDRVFPAVAKSEGVALYPDLLSGVAGRAALNQRDGIHPNEKGVAIIAAHLAPLLARSLARPT